MNELTLSTLLKHIQRVLDDYLPLQIDDPAHPEVGGVINPEIGMTDPWQAEKLIKLIVYRTLISGSMDDKLMERAILTADHLLQVQRPSGLIDLRSVNIDSSPDTGFTVQALCAMLDVALRQAQGKPFLATNPLWATLLTKVEQFIRRALPGLLSGGFHTPNHRWVITSALVYAHTLFPDLDVAGTVEAYLAEGFDIDEDGTYIERSIGVYDAVNNRALLLIAEFWNRPDALDAVARNLDFDLHMLHADGTAVTNLSRRQDYGTRNVPIGLIPCFLLLNRQQPDPTWTAAAHHLWASSHTHSGFRYWDLGYIDWICYALLKDGEPDAVQASLPTNFARHYPVNGVWRVRREQLSASVFGGKTGLFSLAYGQAELSNVKISFTYFGKECGWFVGDTSTSSVTTATGSVTTATGLTAVLHSTGLNHPRRPAYELPLGRPVPPEKWDEMMHERELRHLPPIAGDLTVTEVDGGFDLHLQTTDGMENVAGQIAFDFAPGGVWETADTRFAPQAGQEIFLKQGTGAMRYGNDVIQISPGHGAHSFWQMRAAEPAPNHVRVLLTFFTPVDHLIHLRVYRGLAGDGL